MADYYIYAVHQEKDVIETVKICISYNVASESSKACPHKEPRVEENGKLRLNRNISNRK